MSKKEFSYRKTEAEVSAILQKIENGITDIDELSRSIRRAAALLQECKDHLFQTEEEVENVIQQIKSINERE